MLTGRSRNCWFLRRYRGLCPPPLRERDLGTVNSARPGRVAILSSHEVPETLFFLNTGNMYFIYLRFRPEIWKCLCSREGREWEGMELSFPLFKKGQGKMSHHQIYVFFGSPPPILFYELYVSYTQGREALDSLWFGWIVHKPIFFTSFCSLVSFEIQRNRGSGFMGLNGH